jgi:methionine-rich copper-binding protein CopC
LLGLVATPVAAAQAAPEYVSSEPEDGATLHKAPDRVEATFNEPLDESSTLKVIDECNRQLDDGSTEVDGSSMSIGIVKKPAGEYHVEYVARSIEGLTGETEGHFMFTVHFGKACDGDGGDHHGNDDDDDDNGNHDGHGGNGGGDDHDDMSNHDDGDHETSGHEAGTDHSTTGTDHADHDEGGMGGGHDKHNKKNGGHSKHEKHRKSADPEEDLPGIASPDDTRKLLDRADSTALIAALALCALLGILGGAVLRLSARH